MNTSAPRGSDYEGELARQTLISEQRRSVVLAATFGAILLLLLGYYIWLALRGQTIPGFLFILGAVAIGTAYEWVNSRLVAHCIRTSRVRPRYRPYLSACFEIALPTVSILIVSHYNGPLNGLASPASYGYFIFIILSALRLDFWICAFTGLIASIAYALMMFIYWPQLEAQWVGTAAALRLHLFMRPVLLFAGGCVAGIVSLRIRTMLVDTIGQMQERERIIDLFGQHVSPVVVTQLLTQPTGHTSELRDVCIMVLDIRNFTTFSEDRAAEEVVAYLNTLWSFMVRTVNEHGGIVNKFLGDGFLAVFGAPMSEGMDSRNAIAASRSILSEMARLADAGELPPTRIGIALHAGPAIVGNVGSSERKEYTVIGDVVNVAFRIEAMNKEFDSALLISEPVRQAVEVEDAEPIPPITIRGRRDPVALYRLV